MFRDRLTKLGFPRRIDKWIEPIAYTDAVDKPEGFRAGCKSAVAWLSDYFLVIHPGGTSSEYTHDIVEPLDAVRIPDFEQTSVVQQGLTGKFAFFEAFRHQSGKDRVAAKIEKLRPALVPDQEGGMMFVEGRNAQFRDLKLGDLIELRVCRDFYKPPDQGPFTWNHIFLSGTDLACAHRRITIAVHESVEHELATHNFDTQPEEWRDRGYVFRRWELRGTPAIEFEQNQPNARDSEPWIDVSSCPDWTPIAKWLNKHLITPPKSRQETIALLERIAPQELDRHERVVKCYDYCREQVAYGRRHGLGPEADAQPGDDVATSQRGDCKDQTSLLMALLEEIGVPCRAAAVTVGDPSRIGFLPSQRFDHVILACELDGANLWLDPTADHVVFGGILPDLEGTRALLVAKDDSFEFQTIPHTPMAANSFVYRANARFEDRDLVIDLELQISGRFASTMRAWEVRAADSTSKGIEAMCTDRLGPCTVEDIRLADGWRQSDPFSLTAKITAPNWIKIAGGDMRLIELPWIGAHMTASSVAPSSRQRDYLTGGPDRAEYHLNLELPEGVTLDVADGTREFHGPDYTGRIDISPDGSVLEFRMSLETATSRIAAEDYPDLRRFVHELVGFFDEQHLLRS